MVWPGEFLSETGHKKVIWLWRLSYLGSVGSKSLVVCADYFSLQSDGTLRVNVQYTEVHGALILIYPRPHFIGFLLFEFQILV